MMRSGCDVDVDMMLILMIHSDVDIIECEMISTLIDI